MNSSARAGSGWSWLPGTGGWCRPVAVKIVHAGRLGGGSGAGARSTTEAQLLARLDRPHIVRVHDYAEVDGILLIVMELLGGGTLARRQQGMPPETACAAGLAVAAALSCAHAHGVLHHDVKPDNVLFDTAGLLKVTDFGTAKIVEGSAATASTVAGTPTYMAPEQITGGRLGPATDLYSLGVLLYQLLSGAPPFDPSLGMHAVWQHHLGTTPTPPAGVAAPVVEVVLRALAKDPARRPQSAHAFALDSPWPPPAPTGPAGRGDPAWCCTWTTTSATPPTASPRPSCRRRPSAHPRRRPPMVCGTTWSRGRASVPSAGRPAASYAAPRRLGGPLTGAVGEVTSAVFSPDGTLLATGERGGAVRLWTMS